mgnify:CR=1 FL=1
MIKTPSIAARLVPVLGLLLASSAFQVAAQNSGINALTKVSELKAEQAQTPAVPQHSAQQKLQLQRDRNMRNKLLKGLEPVNEITPAMQKLGEQLRKLGQLQRSQPKNKKQLHRLARAAIAELSRLQNSARKAQKGFQSAEQQVPAAGGAAAAGKLVKQLRALRRDLEAQDRMGNFEIQRLMSQYNQSEQLASSVQKKKDDTNNAIIGKI